MGSGIGVYLKLACRQTSQLVTMKGEGSVYCCYVHSAEGEMEIPQWLFNPPSCDHFSRHGT